MTILKHICNDTRYIEPEYSYINEFIVSQVPAMQNFFKKLICPQRTVALSSSFYTGSFIAAEDTGLEAPSHSHSHILSSAKTKKHIEHMNEINRLKIFTVVLSLEDLLFLAELVVEHEEEVVVRGWKDIARYARYIKGAYEGSIAASAHEKVFLYFCKKEWGESFDMEHSYVVSLNKAPVFSDESLAPGEVKLLAKCQEAVRSLLLSLDMSLFFDPDKNWDFAEILDFVVQFSYLFEGKRESLSSVPIKLLAQFLATYLPKLPAQYKAQNYRRLYIELMLDTETRFQKVRSDANQNKKVLLLVINFIEKHVKDIEQESKVQESVQRKKQFQEIIRTKEIHACVFNKRESEKHSLLVIPMHECPHARVAFAQDLIRGGRPNVQLELKQHVRKIDEFLQVFVSKDEVVQCCDSDQDPHSVGQAFFSYIELIRLELFRSGYSEDDIEITIEEIEKYLTSSMYKKIFPDQPSIEDTKLYQKTLELDWVKPEHLDIAPDQRNEDMWGFAIAQLVAMNKEKTPAQKLDCLGNCMNIIVNVLALVSGSGVGTDDTLPIIIYVVIKSKPTRLFSNLNYILKFRHPDKMIGRYGFVFQQFQSAAIFIEGLGASDLTVDAAEFYRNCEESKNTFELND